MKILVIKEVPTIEQVLALIVEKSGFSLIGNTSNLDEAAQIWEKKTPDLCIYDIHEGRDKLHWKWLFEMIAIKPLPLIVSTQQLSYEIKSYFSYFTLLLKPVTIKGFRQAVSYALVNFKESESIDKVWNDRVFIKDQLNNYKCLLIQEVLWAKGEGNYTRIVTRERDHLIRIFLGGFLEKMPQDRFARTHKSYIVNLREVTEIRHDKILVKESEIPLAKSYRNEFLSRFQLF